MKLKIRTQNVIDVSDWDQFVREVYKRPYNFQQQEGCQSRGTHAIEVPDSHAEEFEYENESIPEVVNGDEMGVKFSTWLARDPKKPIPDQQYDWQLDLWWERNFYPSIEMVANDLYNKGLLEKGSYLINITW